jgi:hypothetical protein
MCGLSMRLQWDYVCVNKESGVGWKGEWWRGGGGSGIPLSEQKNENKFSINKHL